MASTWHNYFGKKFQAELKRLKPDDEAKYEHSIKNIYTALSQDKIDITCIEELEPMSVNVRDNIIKEKKANFSGSGIYGIWSFIGAAIGFFVKIFDACLISEHSLANKYLPKIHSNLDKTKNVGENNLWKMLKYRDSLCLYWVLQALLRCYL